MKMAELRQLPHEELMRELREAQRAIFNLRFQRETERLEKPAELRKARKKVARILTLLRERTLAQTDNAGKEGKGA